MKDKRIKFLPAPSILNKTNPEIFTTKPRPGNPFFGPDGRENSMIHDELEGAPAAAVNTSTSREYRLIAALEESNWSVEGSEERDESVLAPDPLNDCMDMLAVTLSTVMFLAAGAACDLSKQQLNWAIQYLTCIQDDFGNVPPNARGILNHLKYLYNNDLDQFADKPVRVDESGRIVEGTDMNRTERTTTKVTHKPEDELPPTEEA